MKGMVIYLSKWGNSRQIAEAIADGLTESGHEAEAVAVKSAGSPDPSMNFIVLGGPTRAAHAYGPIKRLAKKLKDGWKGKYFATFSTGASVATEKPNTQASERMYDILEANGLVPLAPPFKAGVKDMHGPLVEGEVERAGEFGKELGGILSEKA